MHLTHSNGQKFELVAPHLRVEQSTLSLRLFCSSTSSYFTQRINAPTCSVA